MRDLRQIRGSGIRHTLPFVSRFSGTWLVVSAGAVLVASVSTFLAVYERQAGAEVGTVLGLLAIQTLLIVLCLLLLAVFTTHRVAGPWIAMRRALEDLRAGRYGRTLHFREHDRYLSGVEDEFNALSRELAERSGADRADRTA